jgi:hypothetical protein
VAKAGLVVVRVEFDADGNMTGVVTGKPTLAAVGDNDDDAPPAIDRSDWH